MDGCYLQLQIEGCVFANLAADQVFGGVAAVCAGQVTIRRWVRRRAPGQEYRREVTITLRHGGAVRESRHAGWALRGIAAPPQRFAPY